VATYAGPLGDDPFAVPWPDRRAIASLTPGTRFNRQSQTAYGPSLAATPASLIRPGEAGHRARIAHPPRPHPLGRSPQGADPLRLPRGRRDRGDGPSGRENGPR